MIIGKKIGILRHAPCDLVDKILNNVRECDWVSMRKYQVFIGGKWRDPSTGEWFDALNPYDGTVWAQIPRCNSVDVDEAVAAAGDAFASGRWSSLVSGDRAALLRKAGDLLAERAERIAEVETRDIGKRITESVPQIRYIATWFHYYAGLADKIDGRVVSMDRDDVFSYTLKEPLGVVAAITPWNSPVMIAVWKLAPALAAGNTVVLKPSEEASASTIELMSVFEDVGFPPGVVNLVTGFADEVGKPLVAHPHVAKVTFTGSEGVGRQVNVSAAASFKRVTLELGGKSPQIVFPDADLESAVNGVISGIFLSNGQTCVAGSRLLLHRQIAEAFIEKLTSALDGLTMGDPFETETQIGPVANRAQLDKIRSFIEEAKAQGATCIYGGTAGAGAQCGQGFFVEPTIFADVTPDMRIAREEIFGPVLTVMLFDDAEEAIWMANDSAYGLAAGIWTSDVRRAHVLARRLKSGTVYVNAYRAVSVAVPVGGYKSSGFGRENGLEAIDEFTQTKSVWISIGEAMTNPLAAPAA